MAERPANRHGPTIPKPQRYAWFVIICRRFVILGCVVIWTTAVDLILFIVSLCNVMIIRGVAPQQVSLVRSGPIDLTATVNIEDSLAL
jgi:hypothetical protein